MERCHAEKDWGGVGAEPARREERAFEVRTEDARASQGSLLRHCAQRGDEVGLAGGDERRLERRHPRLEQCIGGLAIPVGVSAEEVDAGEAVHLEVDQARDRDTAAATLEADRDDNAVLDLDVAGLEPPIDLHTEPHDSRAFRTTPSTPSSRRCASAASMPASSETIATLVSPPEAASASSTWAASAPVACATMRWTRARSFLAVSGLALGERERSPQIPFRLRYWVSRWLRLAGTRRKTDKANRSSVQCRFPKGLLGLSFRPNSMISL